MKKILLTLILIILVITIFYVIKKDKKTDSQMLGKWISDPGTIIKTIKEYKDDKPIYVEENIVEYWLEIREDSVYILYSVDNDNKVKLLETGNYNENPNNKNTIYFSPNNIGNKKKYIWNCNKDKENKFNNCTNYATEFSK